MNFAFGVFVGIFVTLITRGVVDMAKKKKNSKNQSRAKGAKEIVLAPQAEPQHGGGLAVSPNNEIVIGGKKQMLIPSGTKEQRFVVASEFDGYSEGSVKESDATAAADILARQSSLS